MSTRLDMSVTYDQILDKALRDLSIATIRLDRAMTHIEALTEELGKLRPAPAPVLALVEGDGT